jgi:hypothetical protein
MEDMYKYKTGPLSIGIEKRRSPMTFGRLSFGSKEV